MKRLSTCPACIGAALAGALLLTILFVGLASAASAPSLEPGARASLLRASADPSLLPWQRHVMRGLARGPSPAGAMATAGAWSQLGPPLPPVEAPAVYDPVRQRMLVFGVVEAYGATNELWELPLSGAFTWTRLQTSGAKPSPRMWHVLLYDSVQDRLLFFGGADSVTYNDFWALDLAASPLAWSQGHPTGPLPPRRAHAQAVFDSLNNRAIVFGGVDSVFYKGSPTGFLSDVWALPFTGPFAWTSLTPTGTPPSPRCGAAVIYDRPRQRMVLFGGYDGNVLDDAFTLSLGSSPAWAPLGASGGPPPARAFPGVICAAPQDRMILFGGYDGRTRNDVWALDLAVPAWTQWSPTGGPPTPRTTAATVYDVPRNRMVIFGGLGPGSDLGWMLSLGATPAWTDLGWHLPPDNVGAACAYDPTRRVMWIHGGVGWDGGGEIYLSDLWSLEMGSPAGWTQPATSGTPLGKRTRHTAIYDSARDRLVFFGGSDSLTDYFDVWALSLAGTPTWSQIATQGIPPGPSGGHRAFYDAVRDRMVFVSEMCALSFTGTPTWVQLPASGNQPAGLYGSIAALDTAADRIIVFGGEVSGIVQNKVYAVSLTDMRWTELTPSGTPPPPRMEASMVALGSRMLVFGGADGCCANAVFFNDTWLLTLDPTPSWQQLDVGTLLPAARAEASAAFDRTSFQLVIHGGSGPRWALETWALQLDEEVEVLASLVSANAEPGRVEITWQLSSAAAAATVSRSAGGGQWVEVATLDADGTGRLTFVDRDVTAGTRYGYRLGLSGPGGDVFAGEVWIDVPGAPRLALRGFRPNPARAAGACIAFSLPDASPARLDVVDVGGRRVFSRDVGGLGSGEHVVRVGDEHSLPPGLYVVRLTRAGRVLTTKAVAIE